MAVHAVVGAAYGDEGKGVLTDALCAQAADRGDRAVVVRFNGGAQAGHTVVLPSGARHVFHHWGAGALAGAATHLGPRFAVHPLLFQAETAALARMGACSRLSVDPRAPLTLPSDVMINHAIEAARGAARHGSCGVGFGEACERHEHPAFGLNVGQAAGLDHGALVQRLLEVAQGYVPGRLAALGLAPDAVGPRVADPGLLARYAHDIQAFLAAAHLASSSILTAFGTVVFEGAQGLALDEDLGAFPHVTRSKTGLPYAVALAEEAGLTALTAWYATRAYTTRHGAGPLPHETPAPPAPRFADETNLPNAHQGTLRFAPLDPQALAARIAADLARAGSAVAVTPGLAVGCLDQMGETTPLAGDERSWPTSQVGTRLAQAVGVDRWWEGRHPSRHGVTAGPGSA